MKFLKYTLIVIVVLVAIFFSFGLFKSTVTYGAEISVNKPIEEAWAVSQDLSKYPLWLEGFKSMELIEGEYMAAGSKYRIIVNPGDGQPDFEMIETLVSLKEFEQVEMDFDNEMMDFKQTISFSEKDGMTVIKTDSKVIARNFIMRSMFAMMEGLAGSFTAQETKNMNSLKKLIEENTTDYYPAVEEAVMDTIQ